MRHLQILTTWFCPLTLLAFLGGAELALGKECEFAVKATDDIVFDVTVIKIQKECKKLRINFRHHGTVLKHNWVLVKKSELERLKKDGEAAGEQANFLPKNKAGIIAQTKMLAPGSEDSIEIDVAQIKRGADYAYFCSFPGHGATMKGVLRFGSN